MRRRVQRRKRRRWVGSVVLTGLLSVGVTNTNAQVAEVLDAAGDGAHGLALPSGLALGADGALYVAGRNSNNVYAVSAAGSVTEIHAVPGTNPRDVAVDDAQNVYVAREASDDVVRVAPGGAATIVIDAAGDGAHPLDGPRSVAIDSTGNLFVSGRFSHNVFRVTPAGVVTEVIGPSGDGIHPLTQPFGDIATDEAGNLYVSGQLSDNVFRVSPAGGVDQILDATGDGVHALSSPAGVAIGPAGEVYVAGRESHNVFCVTAAGAIAQWIDASGDGVHPLGDPRAVAVDRFGNVVVTGRLTDNAFRITPQGSITEILDGAGDGSHVLSSPVSLESDDAGRVWVAGEGSANVFRVETFASLELTRATAWPTRSKPGRVSLRGTSPAIDVSQGLTLVVTDGLAMDVQRVLEPDDCQVKPSGKIRCRWIGPEKEKTKVVLSPRRSEPGRVSFRVFLGRLDFVAPQAGPISLTVIEGDADGFHGSIEPCQASLARLACKS